MKQQTDCLRTGCIIRRTDVEKRRFGIEGDLLTECLLEEIILQGAGGE